MGSKLRALLLVVGVWIASVGWAAEWVNLPEVETVVVELPAIPSHFETHSGHFLRVHGPNSSTATLLQLAQAGSTSITEIAGRLNVPIGGTIHVYVAESEEQFRDFQRGNPPLWADGTAYPAAGLIVLKQPSIRGGQADPLVQVLKHELVHILLGRAFLPNRPPSWLQEGVAQVVAGELGPEQAEQLQQGAALGTLSSLESLTRGFPQDPVRAQLAYAQAADFVAWFEEKHGSEALQHIIREQLQGHPFEYAVRKATGEPLERIEAAWRARYERTVPLISLSSLAKEEVLFGFAGVLLLVGGLLRRRQFKHRLEEMAREERQKDAIIQRVIEQNREHRRGPREGW